MFQSNTLTKMLRLVIPVIIISGTLPTSILCSVESEYNKTNAIINITYKKFKENEVFQVKTYGDEIYIEACSGIVHSETFATIPKVLRFMMFDSHFASFDLAALLKFTHLESVNIVDVTGLTVLTNRIMTGFQHLKRLSIFNTDVKFDHDTFQNLMTLEYLSISKVDVAILGNEVFTDSNIKELYWTFSGIEKIDKYCFSPLRNIEIINLSGNKIEYLWPETFLGLKHLERLYLKKNKLAAINFRYLEYLPNLKYLDISLNAIAAVKIQEIRRNLPNLTTIVINRDSILSDGSSSNEKGLNIVRV